MENKQAILNCITKSIEFRFKDELFNIDLTEGDLHDSWNSITLKDGTTLDFNFGWEEDELPNLSLYGLTLLDDGSFEINYRISYNFEIIEIIGTQDNYFN